ANPRARVRRRERQAYLSLGERGSRVRDAGARHGWFTWPRVALPDDYLEDVCVAGWRVGLRAHRRQLSRDIETRRRSGRSVAERRAVRERRIGAGRTRGAVVFDRQ